LDFTAIPIEDALDLAAPTGGPITLLLPGHTLTGVRIAGWNRAAGILLCRGGNGFTDEDVHYIRVAQIQAMTLRAPAPRAESDRLGADIRDALRHAAGYPLSLAIRPDAFLSAPGPLSLWLANIVEAVTALDVLREPFQAQVDQILLREGETSAVLGGSTLILEARPEAIPSAPAIRAAIEPLLL